uniref:Uncharacterized protein n=1 Tax=Caenorhabditis japonica TaxID=281687 RepID=A0A8R1E6J6_CAEJA
MNPIKKDLQSLHTVTQKCLQDLLRLAESFQSGHINYQDTLRLSMIHTYVFLYVASLILDKIYELDRSEKEDEKEQDHTKSN